MDAFRRLPADAHVGTLRAVEINDACQLHLACRPVRDGHLVEPFTLEDPVRPLGDGVLERITALGLLMRIPHFLTSDTYASLQFWLPRSEWWMRPRAVPASMPDSVNFFQGKTVALFVYGNLTTR